MRDTVRALKTPTPRKKSKSVSFSCACIVCGASFMARDPRKNACSPECDREKRRMHEARCRARRRQREKEIPSEKVCYRCRESLPSSAFGKNVWNRDGLQGMCSPCRREYDTEPEQREKNRERKAFWYLLHHEETRLRQNTRYHEDPQFRARQNAEGHARYWADPKGKVDRARERRREQRRLEQEDARRCVCGQALPASDEEGPWFCKTRCKAHCIRQITGGALRDLLLKLRAASDLKRLPPDEERLIHRTAAKTASLWAGRGHAISDEDLFSHAYMGAWNAWLTYDETRGAALQSWLITGARREVLEALRAIDPLSRAERKAYKEAAAADPNTPAPRQIVSLDALVASTAEADTPLVMLDRLATDEDLAESILSRLDAEETATRILALLSTGRKHEAEVVRLVGMEGLTMKQAAELLRLSESRIHQLWAAATARIRQEMSA